MFKIFYCKKIMNKINIDVYFVEIHAAKKLFKMYKSN